MVRKLGLFAVALVIAGLAGGCGDSTTAPTGPDLAELAPWFGTYARVDTSIECASKVPSPASGTEVLCSRSALLSPTTQGFRCTAQSISSTHISYACVGKVFYLGDSVSVQVNLNATRAGEHISATARVTASHPLLGTTCTDFRYSLDRTSADTSNCDVLPPLGARWISHALQARGR